MNFPTLYDFRMSLFLLLMIQRFHFRSIDWDMHLHRLLHLLDYFLKHPQMFHKLNQNVGTQ